MLVPHLPGYPSTPGFEFCGLLGNYADFKALEYLIDRERPKIVIEIGVFAGAATLILASRGATVYSVDRWHGSDADPMRERYLVVGARDVLSAYCRNMGELLMRQVIPLVGESRDWAMRWPSDFQADLIHIDGGHQYTDAATDIMNWLPHLKPGGLMTGHDYGSLFPGVEHAVHAVLGEPDEIFNEVWTWRKPIVSARISQECVANDAV